MSLRGEPLIHRLLTLLLLAEVILAVRGMLLSFAENRNPVLLLWTVSEAIVVVMIVLRRPFREISHRPTAWIAALVGTYGPLLVASSNTAIIPWQVAVVPQLVGTVIQIGAKVSLGKSFGLVAANRGVKTGGLYKLVRHPMYAGYLWSHLAFLANNFRWRNVIVYAITWLALAHRITEEERLLSQDPEYAALKKRTRYRLIPWVY